MRSNASADNPRKISIHMCNDIPRVFFFLTLVFMGSACGIVLSHPLPRSCLRGQPTHPLLWRPSTRLERAIDTPSVSIPGMKRHMSVATCQVQIQKKGFCAAAKKSFSGLYFKLSEICLQTRQEQTQVGVMEVVMVTWTKKH